MRTARLDCSTSKSSSSSAEAAGEDGSALAHATASASICGLAWAVSVNARCTEAIIDARRVDAASQALERPPISLCVLALVAASVLSHLPAVNLMGGFDALVGGLKFDAAGRLWAFDSQEFLVLNIARDGRVQQRDFGRRPYSNVNFGADGSIYLAEHAVGGTIRPLHP